MAIEVVTTRVGLRERVASWRAAGETVALVPTMGFLHDGHMSLVDIVKDKADRVVASLFVNPTQFSPSEDLATYPRDQEGDLAKFAAHGVDAVYIPDVSEMYPTGFATSVAVSGFGEGLCAETRPIFFQGVATVVSKLLIQCWPDYAIYSDADSGRSDSARGGWSGDVITQCLSDAGRAPDCPRTEPGTAESCGKSDPSGNCCGGGGDTGCRVPEH